MKLAAFAVAFFTIGAFASQGTEPSIHDYQLAEAEWLIEVAPNTTVPFNGTIQSVVAQLREHGDHRAAARSLGDPAETGKMLAVRATDFGGGAYFCGAKWPWAHLTPFWEGIRYLRSLKGAVRVPAGPSCGRVSCSYSGAIYLCNDGTMDLWLDSFERVADGASYLISFCSTNEWGPTQVSGQLFHPDGWSVVLRRDSC